MRSDERRLPSWPVRRALSWGFLRAPARSGHFPLFRGVSGAWAYASMGDMGISISEQDQWDSGESDG